MHGTIEHPSLTFVLGFLFLLTGVLAALLFFPGALPHMANPNSAESYRDNIAGAKRACVLAENPSAEFSGFCRDNFVEINRSVFLRPRNGSSAAAASIAANPGHELYRFMDNTANANAIFGSSNQSRENRIAAYTRIECAVSEGLSRKPADFQTISWSFDPGIAPHCASMKFR